MSETIETKKRKTELILPVDFASPESDLVRDVPKEAWELLIEHGYVREAQSLTNQVSRYIRRIGTEYVRWSTIFKIIDQFIECIPANGSESQHFDLLEWVNPGVPVQRTDPSPVYVVFPPSFRVNGDYSHMSDPDFKPWTNIVLGDKLRNPFDCSEVVPRIYELLAEVNEPLAKHFGLNAKQFFDVRCRGLQIKNVAQFTELYKIIRHYVWLLPPETAS